MRCNFSRLFTFFFLCQRSQKRHNFHFCLFLSLSPSCVCLSSHLLLLCSVLYHTSQLIDNPLFFLFFFFPLRNLSLLVECLSKRRNTKLKVYSSGEKQGELLFSLTLFSYFVFADCSAFKEKLTVFPTRHFIVILAYSSRIVYWVWLQVPGPCFTFFFFCLLPPSPSLTSHHSFFSIVLLYCC